MEALEAIFTRRSIRKYTKEKVSREQIQIMLKAAMSAPSSRNQQSWRFVVIDDRETLDYIPNIHPYAQMLKEAPCAILVCGDLSLEKSKGNWVLDCSAATQNLLLAAHAIGLGAVWLGVYPREERMTPLNKLLNLPEHVKPLALISIGFPDEDRKIVDRFKPERIHYNKW